MNGQREKERNGETESKTNERSKKGEERILSTEIRHSYATAP